MAHCGYYFQESLSVEEKMLKLQENLKDKDELNYKLKALAVKGKKQYEEMKIQVGIRIYGSSKSSENVEVITY